MAEAPTTKFLVRCDSKSRRRLSQRQATKSIRRVVGGSRNCTLRPLGWIRLMHRSIYRAGFDNVTNTVWVSAPISCEFPWELPYTIARFTHAVTLIKISAFNWDLGWRHFSFVLSFGVFESIQILWLGISQKFLSSCGGWKRVIVLRSLFGVSSFRCLEHTFWLGLVQKYFERCLLFCGYNFFFWLGGQFLVWRTFCCRYSFVSSITFAFSLAYAFTFLGLWRRFYYHSLGEGKWVVPIN